MGSVREWIRKYKKAYHAALDPLIELPGGLESWVDESLEWYVGQFGDEPLRRDVVRPSEFLPAEWDGSEEAARALCLRVCERIGVPADNIRFSFRMVEVRRAARSHAARLVRQSWQSHAESGDPERMTRARELLAITGLPEHVSNAEFAALQAAGFQPELHILSLAEAYREIELCEQIHAREGAERDAALRAAQAYWDDDLDLTVAACWRDLRQLPQGGTSAHDASAIMVNARTLGNPAAVVAQVVHELGHEVLNRGLVKRSRPDNEHLVDLFGVFHGFGIFSLNQALERAGGLRHRRLGYLGERGMTEAMSNYLARRRHLIGERFEPGWDAEIDWQQRFTVTERARELAKKTPPRDGNTSVRSDV
ncbi:hypothetical protein HPO96_28275 [Kribbella sandramycini]|uniref:IrrE N-terminal-like domain-containing protein n=1 Tax=Kribbella sandramycini TaxID=60450 RepID=A0A7Y4P3I7_9ACTN|nr:hypothetical protein [Kribbella sandramycini]MBB6571501.1 hypothetical protein [Kribbella sandramycini]NOL44150.1 hypothetical protein [Kribbella sandramycini]